MPPPSHPPPPPDGLKLNDILFILFRHKWKIIFCALLGLAGAAGLYYKAAPVYESTAKLLVRYVVDSRAAETLGGSGEVRSVDARGANMINSEIEIITSQDLALDVAQSVGPARIMGPDSDQTNRVAAANRIARNLTVSVPRNSNVILISLRHNDPEIAQLALRQLIDRYLERHAEVHRGSGSYDFLRRETDLLRGRLNQSESELQRLKQDARIISLDETKRDLTTRLGRIRQSILDEETQLAGYRARLQELERWSVSRTSTSTTETNEVEQLAPPAPEILDRYRGLMARLTSLQTLEFTLLGSYTTDHPQVRLARRQIEELQSEKRQLETEHPSLSASLPAVAGSTGSIRDSEVDPLTARSLIAAAEARIATLNTQLDAARLEAAEIDKREQAIVELQRRKEIEESRFRYFSEQLEKWRFDAQLDPKSAPNISRVQEPGMAFRATSDLRKHMAIIAALGFAIGIGLALLIDLVLDPSVKRPIEIESRLHVPLILTIPLVGHRARRRLLSAGRKAEVRGRRSEGRSQGSGGSGQSSVVSGQSSEDGDLSATPSSPSPNSDLPSPISHLPSAETPISDLPSTAAQAAPPSPGGTAAPIRPEKAPWELTHFIRPFCDALRDRIILYFQLKNMHHKPKLVAVTGCDHGSGVTTIASGLAAALSETGDGKVLLVDMNVANTQIHPFYQGQLVPHLTEIMDPGTSGKAEIADNLYVATATGPNGHATKLIPKKFYDLMPRLKASDFDYIIFDMPPVNQTSATMALAGFMDQVLLVVEGDKTSRAQIKRAHSILTGAQANVVGVFNKHRDRAPSWLGQDV
jgi:polysaccharide biosynthesis transport protein